MRNRILAIVLHHVLAEDNERAKLQWKPTSQVHVAAPADSSAETKQKLVQADIPVKQV